MTRLNPLPESKIAKQFSIPSSSISFQLFGYLKLNPSFLNVFEIV
ncbi:hypothetical protein [uncultured Methanobrevibacter sp.]